MISLITKRINQICQPESTSFHLDPPYIPPKFVHGPSQAICECQVCKNPKIVEKAEPELKLDPFFNETENEGEEWRDFMFLLKKLIPCKGNPF
jgi:hypothetical protein